MITAAWVRCTRLEEPGPLAGSPTWVSGTPVVGALSAIFQGTLAGAGSRIELLELEPAL